MRQGQAHPAPAPFMGGAAAPRGSAPGWIPEPRALWGSSDDGRQAETIGPAIQGIREGSSSMRCQGCALSLWTKPFCDCRLRRLVLWQPCPAPGLPEYVAGL